MTTPTEPYRPPTLLRELQLLDALELTGSTEQAARWLGVSQPTVSRHCRRIAAEFGLGERQRWGPVGRSASCASLRLLRLAARWHRFEAGTAAVATDPLHQSLLALPEGVVCQPPRFRPAAGWRWLIREAVLDAALVSSLELEEPPTGPDPAAASRSRVGEATAEPDLRGPEEGSAVVDLCLGDWPLELATVDLAWSGERLLVPPRSLAPGLNALLRRLGLETEAMEARLAADPVAWPERLAAGDLALALPALAAGISEDRFRGLARRPTGLRQRLWLLLPARWWRVEALLRLTGRLRALGEDCGATRAGAHQYYWGGGVEWPEAMVIGRAS